MAVRRDSLRARSDFFSPMTGNTSGTRFAGERRGSYTDQAKRKLQDLDTGRTESPVIEAIKVAVQKTEDPFTQIEDKKSYAPEEENDFMGALEGAAGAAQDVVNKGVSKVQDVVRSTGKRAAERRAEQQYKRQQERAADLKAAEDARQKLSTDFQNRVRGVSDEVKTQGDRFKSFSIAQIKRDIDQDIAQRKAAQDAKTYEQNRAKQRAIRQSALDKRISGVESSVSGVRSEVKAYETNREKQRRLTQSRLKGVESGLSNLGANYKAQEQAAIDNMAKFRAGLTSDIDKKISEVRKMYGQGGLPLGTTTQRQGGTVKDGEKITSPKTVTIGGQTVAAKQSVASLPSNYKSTEAEAFRVAKAYQEAKGIAGRNPNVSVGVDSKGRPTATANQKTRSEAGARTAQANAARVKSNAVARAQAAAVNRKLSGKSISQTKAANTASMKAAAAARHASFKKAKAEGTHARTASAQRAAKKAAAKARAKAAAKARNKAKKSKKGSAGCPDPKMLILMANGSQKKAGDLMVGDLIKTNHEKDMKLGEYKVEYINVLNDKQKAKFTFEESEIICSLSHKFYVDNDWKKAYDMVIGDEVSGQKLISIENVEDGDVVHITVEDAHTYICEGLLSHNKRCDIRTKDDISKLTDMNLLRDDLANVAYFVKELQETI